MMTIGFIFWLIMLLILLFWGWSFRLPENKFNFLGFGGSFILWVLLALLGWKVFGSPIGR